MYARNKFGLLCFLLALMGSYLFTSCLDGPGEDVFVINELMATNKTGVLACDGEPHGWIEIRNNSDKAYSLRGFTLTKASGKDSWEFPDTIVQPKSCILVFAAKKEFDDNLSCGFKLSTKGDTIQLLTRSGKVCSVVEYKRLKSDQAIKLTNKGDYKKTYKQTPGFNNDDKGRKAYLQYIESQRECPLRIWEYINKVPTTEKFSRWVEIKNISDKTVDLGEYCITNEMESPDLIQLPTYQLAPGQITAVIYKDKRLKGDCLILTKNKKFADGICAAETYLGVSVGRKEDSNGFFYFSSPTPKHENSTKGFEDVAEVPEFDVEPGIYKKDKIVLKIKTHGTIVHYTVDGKIPSYTSPIYKDSIIIDKNTVVRAFAEQSECLRSKMVTGTYLLNEKHTLPVFSITMDYDDLYDPAKGIYVKGYYAQDDHPYTGANFWQPWEKLAHIEYFDGKEGFSYDCGIRIFGAYSRARSKKSFHIKFGRRYGQTHLEYDLYNRGKIEDVKHLVLRSGSQDDHGVMVRDEFFTRLMSEHSPNLHVQAYRPVILYLNGEYFGVYYIREKVNEEFVGSHLNVDPETATVLMGAGAAEVGTNKEYRALENYARTHDMKNDSVYKYMDEHIDFLSLIDYKIGEYYSGNCDVGNIRFIKSSDPSCDNKWYWIYYDLDWGFYYYTPPRFYLRENCTRASGGSLAPFNLFVSRLLQNPKFRKLFLERWAYHMENTFCEKNALTLFNQMIKDIEPEMERNCKRWPELGYASWQRNVEKFREKLKERPARLHKEMLEELKVTEQERLTYFRNIKF